MTFTYFGHLYSLSEGMVGAAVSGPSRARPAPLANSSGAAAARTKTAASTSVGSPPLPLRCNAHRGTAQPRCIPAPGILRPGHTLGRAATAAAATLDSANSFDSPSTTDALAHTLPARPSGLPAVPAAPPAAWPLPPGDGTALRW